MITPHPTLKILRPPEQWFLLYLLPRLKLLCGSGVGFECSELVLHLYISYYNVTCWTVVQFI